MHGLEHARVKVLSESLGKRQVDVLGALPSEQRFYLYGQVNKIYLQLAPRSPIHGLKVVNGI